MSIQIIWKLFTKNNARLSLARSLFHAPFNGKPHIKLANFCTETTAPSLTPPDRGVVRELLINKCGLTDEEITKAFRHHNDLLRQKSGQNIEDVLELLNGCGLTTPAQIRKVVLCNPHFLFYKSERNLKSKLSLFKTFMNEKDIAKLVQTGARAFDASEGRIKSVISLLQKLGYEGEALSDLLARQPSLIVMSEEKVMESFKQVEDIGLKKGSKLFAIGLRSILVMGIENLGRKQQFLSSLGFSEKQISELLRKRTLILELSEEKIKRNLDFLVKTAGLPLTDLVKYPGLFAYSLEKRMIPRYRVLEALKSMQVQMLKKALFSKNCYADRKTFLGRIY
jgi:mTERF domain-containing protein